MFTKQIGNVTVHFEPLIIFLAVVMAVAVFSALSLSVRGKKIKRAFELGEYDKVLKDGERLLKTYLNYAKRYKHRNTIAWIEYLHFSLAVSNLALMNWEPFLNHINALSQHNDVKSFWLSLYYILQNNLEEASSYHDMIAQTEENATNISFLDCLIWYNKGDVDLAKNKMKGIYPLLKYPVLKDIANKFFAKNQF